MINLNKDGAMQDHFNKLVQVCFYGIIIFVGAVALGSKMGQVGPVLIFGLILFAIVLSTQFGVMASRKDGASMAGMIESIRKRPGGAATLAVIVLVAISLLVALV